MVAVDDSCNVLAALFILAVPAQDDFFDGDDKFFFGLTRTKYIIWSDAYE